MCPPISASDGFDGANAVGIIVSDWRPTRADTPVRPYQPNGVGIILPYPTHAQPFGDMGYTFDGNDPLLTPIGYPAPGNYCRPYIRRDLR